MVTGHYSDELQLTSGLVSKCHISGLLYNRKYILCSTLVSQCPDVTSGVSYSCAFETGVLYSTLVTSGPCPGVTGGLFAALLRSSVQVLHKYLHSTYLWLVHRPLLWYSGVYGEPKCYRLPQHTNYDSVQVACSTLQTVS